MAVSVRGIGVFSWQGMSIPLEIPLNLVDAYDV